MSTKPYRVIDQNLFSASIDNTRNYFASYWTIASGATGLQPVWIHPEGYSIQRNTDYNDIVETELNTDYIEKISINFALETTASSHVIFPNRMIPVRAYGNVDNIINDEQWRAVMFGGTWTSEEGAFSYPGIYRLGAYDVHNFEFETAYSLREARNLGGNEAYAEYMYYNMNYDYNSYYKKYENTISSRTEYEIPNAYYIQSLIGDLNVEPNIIKFISREGILYPSDDGEDGTAAEITYMEIPVEDLLTPKETILPPPYTVTSEDIVEGTSGEITYTDRTYNIRTYLTGAYTLVDLSGTTNDYLRTKTRNLFFNEESIDNLFADVESNKSKYPFYINVNVVNPTEIEKDWTPGSPNTIFKDAIQSSGLEEILLERLKDKFRGSRAYSDYTAVQHTTVLTSSYDTETAESTLIEHESTRDRSFPMIDFAGLLMEIVNEPDLPAAGDIYFVGDKNLKTRIVDNPAGTFRYAHTIGAIRMIDELKAFMEENAAVRPTQEGYFNTETEEDYGGFLGFLNYAENSSYRETIAYRISKGNTSVDQDIWLTNCESLGSDFAYVDTQVRYGERYAYTVYAYDVVAGYKYRISDGVVSTVIGSAPVDIDGDGVDDEDWSCIQFEDRGNVASDQLFFDFADNPLSASNQFATNAQTLSEHKYLFDFNLTIEPSIKIIERAVASHMGTVLDHPPVKIDVTPYQRVDNSQIIGFFSTYESFSPRKYPVQLNTAEQATAEVYLMSNNLLSTTEIEVDSVSRVRYVDVYRLSDKPTSMKQFNDGYITTKDLLITGTDFTDTTCFYEEQIQTNTKYYYLFRFRSEHEMPGQCSRIIAAEMIDDGGYKYTTFDELTAADLEKDNFEDVSIPFKKLINLIPNINQLEFEYGDVDLAETAFSQIEKLSVGTLSDSLWGKTFKLRLTSKKTGKKIDLNVTYNLKEEL